MSGLLAELFFLNTVKYFFLRLTICNRLCDKYAGAPELNLEESQSPLIPKKIGSVLDAVGADVGNQLTARSRTVW
jgi:hypothetical protein